MRTIIACPCGDMVHTAFLRSLVGMEIRGDVQFTFAQGSLVYDARNQLAETAVAGGFDRILWLDSDMEFPKETFTRLSDLMDEGKEMVSALCFTRRNPIKPVGFTRLYFKEENGLQVPHADRIEEIPDAPFTVAAVGMAVCMMTVDLVARIKKTFGLPFSPAYGFGEDLSFCQRATALGTQVWIDPTLDIGHIGQACYNRRCYDAVKRTNA